MKKVALLLMLALLCSTSFAQIGKKLPEDLWGLILGRTNADKARTILVENGLKIVEITEKRIVAEGEFLIDGLNYYSVSCIFANNKLCGLLIVGECKDINEVNRLFEKQFKPIMGLNDAERDALRQMTGMTDCDILASANEEKECMSCLFTLNGSEAFVLCYMWTKATDEIIDTGASFEYGNAGENDVTKFMGIPVDGTYEEMVNKLIGKGFKPAKISGKDILTGIFNGEEVIISIITNGDKVCRIAVMDMYSRKQGDIIIRYNKLIAQFLNGGKYFPISCAEIDQTEDISYEMQIKNKRYQVSFLQKTDSFKNALETIKMVALGEAKQYFSQYDIENNYESKVVPFITERISKIIADRTWNTSVWFTMLMTSYDQFSIVIYYENPRNMANGEDL